MMRNPFLTEADCQKDMEELIELSYEFTGIQIQKLAVYLHSGPQGMYIHLSHKAVRFGALLYCTGVTLFSGCLQDVTI
jgi:hypothetical protein